MKTARTIFLPCKGRWQAEGLTEGGFHKGRPVWHAPSTSFAGPPPLAGEELTALSRHPVQQPPDPGQRFRLGQQRRVADIRHRHQL